MIVAVTFLATSLGITQVRANELVLPAPGVMVPLSDALKAAKLKGIKVHPDNPFKFDFILDRGQDNSSDETLKATTTNLIKYFLASLTTPEKDLWVNLSPYEKERIVPESFGQTTMGRDLLAQDYLLKQVTASLIYPEKEVGKKFWDRVYAEAQKKFGTSNIPVNTFNKVWIVPNKAVVYENAQNGTAYIVDASLKVMLEEDYLALDKNNTTSKDNHSIGSQVVREIVIPMLTQEVNQGANFIKMRQVYYAYILAAWYKKKIKDGILSSVYLDQNKIAGVSIDNPQQKQEIYNRYVEAFKKGVYNYVKEDIDINTNQTIPRKYFSGGVVLTDSAMSIANLETIVKEYPTFFSNTPVVATAYFVAAGIQIKGLVDKLRGKDAVNVQIKTSQTMFVQDLERLEGIGKVLKRELEMIMKKDPLIKVAATVNRAGDAPSLVLQMFRETNQVKQAVGQVELVATGLGGVKIRRLYLRDIDDVDGKVIVINPVINEDYYADETLEAYEELANLLLEQSSTFNDKFSRAFEISKPSKKVLTTILGSKKMKDILNQAEGNTNFEVAGKNIEPLTRVFAWAVRGLTRKQIKDTIQDWLKAGDPNIDTLLMSLFEKERTLFPSQQYGSNAFGKLFIKMSNVIKSTAESAGYSYLELEVSFPDSFQNYMLYHGSKWRLAEKPTVLFFATATAAKLAVLTEKKNMKSSEILKQLLWKITKDPWFQEKHRLYKMQLPLTSKKSTEATQPLTIEVEDKNVSSDAIQKLITSRWNDLEPAEKSDISAEVSKVVGRSNEAMSSVQVDLVQNSFNSLVEDPSTFIEWLSKTSKKEKNLMITNPQLRVSESIFFQEVEAIKNKDHQIFIKDVAANPYFVRLTVNNGDYLGEINLTTQEAMRVRQSLDKVKALEDVFVKRSFTDAMSFANSIYARVNSMKEAQPNKAQSNLGGIDLKSDRLNLELQNQGGAIAFKVTPEMLAQLRDAAGFEPVVLDMKPVGDVGGLKSFLGVVN